MIVYGQILAYYALIMLEDSIRIMLALCSMLHLTNYAKNYAGIMGAGLVGICFFISTFFIIACFSIITTILNQSNSKHKRAYG